MKYLTDKCSNLFDTWVDESVISDCDRTFAANCTCSQTETNTPCKGMSIISLYRKYFLATSQKIAELIRAITLWNFLPKFSHKFQTVSSYSVLSTPFIIMYVVSNTDSLLGIEKICMKTNTYKFWKSTSYWALTTEQLKVTIYKTPPSYTKHYSPDLYLISTCHIKQLINHDCYMAQPPKHHRILLLNYNY